MANAGSMGLEPFLRIFIDPRATIRRIIDTDPRRHVLAIAAIGPALATLESQWAAALSGKTMPTAIWPIAVVAGVAVSAVLGIVALYFNGWFMRWAGGLLGGIANSEQVRAALAWGQIPGIVAAALGILMLLLGLASPLTMSPGGMPKFNGSLVSFGLLNGVLAGWGFVATLHCVGEVHRFSAWRALGAFGIELLVTLICFAILALFVVVMIHSLR